MTMDINVRSTATHAASSSRRPSPSPSTPSYSPSLPTSTLATPTRHIKRSFDVAFLVAPDEKLTRRNQEKQLRLVATGSLLKKPDSEAQGDSQLDRSYIETHYPPPPSLNFVHRQKPPLPPPPHINFLRSPHDMDHKPPRSAFTKVAASSPRSSSSLSPDHVVYQDSMSPPTTKNLYQPAEKPSFKSVEHVNNFRTIDSYLLKSNNNQYYNQVPVLDKEMSFMNGNKIRANMLYHHPDSVTYSTLAAAYPFATNFQASSNASINPAVAAVVSASLLPSSFATFSLPAQNVCAKCNISFRMTSDLVYHMRSHHKGDHIAADPLRRRRDQDKLKCPVCSESFRERHHLTRHMTAHQDKAGDVVDHDDERVMGGGK